jgi:hypothetical protein
MPKPRDTWYIRLPDGRVIRAGSTAAVRRSLQAGRLPPESRVRRSSREAWAGMGSRAEFADLLADRARPTTPLPPSLLPGRSRPGAGRGRPGLRLRTAGVPRFAEELLKALDRTLIRGRLTAVAVAALAGAALVLLAVLLRPGQQVWAPLPWVAAVAGALLAHAVASCLLTQITFIELSRLRPASRAETTAGLVRNTARLVLVELVVGGAAWGALAGLGWLREWLAGQEVGEAVVGGVSAARVVVEVALGPLLGLALLLAPVVVIGERSVPGALAEWAGLLRRHLGRAFLYETLALVLGVAVSFLLAVPVALAAWSCTPAELANPVVLSVLTLLGALALTPLLAYLAVANAFLYLGLKYDQPPVTR